MLVGHFREFSLGCFQRKAALTLKDLGIKPAKLCLAVSEFILHGAGALKCELCGSQVWMGC